jgi:hypothetical protein
MFQEFQPMGGVEARDFDEDVMTVLSSDIYASSIERFSTEINN